MTPLKFKMTHDLLFKMLFVKYPDLLRKLVAVLLDISYDSITEFTIANPEIPPETLGDKFCRLDINMTVNGQRIDLEVQVENEGNYPERSLFIWAKEYSTGISLARITKIYRALSSSAFWDLTNLPTKKNITTNFNALK